MGFRTVLMSSIPFILSSYHLYTAEKENPQLVRISKTRNLAALITYRNQSEFIIKPNYGVEEKNNHNYSLVVVY